MDITDQIAVFGGSSEYGGDYGYGEAIDGNVATFWQEGAPYNTSDQFLSADFGEIVSITTVNVLLAQWAAAYGATTCKIQKSSDGSSWVDVTSFTPAEAGNAITVNQTGRYWRLFMPMDATAIWKVAELSFESDGLVGKSFDLTGLSATPISAEIVDATDTVRMVVEPGVTVGSVNAILPIRVLLRLDGQTVAHTAVSGEGTFAPTEWIADAAGVRVYSPEETAVDLREGTSTGTVLYQRTAGATYPLLAVVPADTPLYITGEDIDSTLIPVTLVAGAITDVTVVPSAASAYISIYMAPSAQQDDTPWVVSVNGGAPLEGSSPYMWIPVPPLSDAIVTVSGFVDYGDGPIAYTHDTTITSGAVGSNTSQTITAPSGAVSECVSVLIDPNVDVTAYYATEAGEVLGSGDTISIYVYPEFPDHAIPVLLVAPGYTSKLLNVSYANREDPEVLNPVLTAAISSLSISGIEGEWSALIDGVVYTPSMEVSGSSVTAVISRTGYVTQEVVIPVDGETIYDASVLVWVTDVASHAGMNITLHGPVGTHYSVHKSLSLLDAIPSTEGSIPEEGVVVLNVLVADTYGASLICPELEGSFVIKVGDPTTQAYNVVFAEGADVIINLETLDPTFVIEDGLISAGSSGQSVIPLVDGSPVASEPLAQDVGQMTVTLISTIPYAVTIQPIGVLPQIAQPVTPLEGAITLDAPGWLSSGWKVTFSDPAAKYADCSVDIPFLADTTTTATFTLVENVDWEKWAIVGVAGLAGLIILAIALR